MIRGFVAEVLAMGDSTLSVRLLAIARLAIGALQGLALYLIYVAYEERSWPATNGYIFAPAPSPRWRGCRSHNRSGLL